MNQFKSIRKISLSCKNQEVIRSLTGQKPFKSIARKSIAGFSIRQGDSLGFFLTLRRATMRRFISRLFYMNLPKRRFLARFKTTEPQKSITLVIPDCRFFMEIENKPFTKQGSAMPIQITFDFKEACTLDIQSILKDEAQRVSKAL